MDVGIGLPNMIPGTDGSVLVDWAVRAERAGFSTLATLGRLVYDSYDEMIALAAAAAVTTRIRLTTSVLLAPLHTNTALLAKQVTSLDRLSGGRLTLGIGIGGRDDDYEASGLPTTGRGRRLDEMLEEMKRIWREAANAIGPRPANPGGPPLIMARGTANTAVLRRAARVADGAIMGGGTPEMFAGFASAVDEVWRDFGRTDRPRKLALAYFSLGEDARANADSYIKHYYAWLGAIAEQLAAGVAVDAAAVKACVSGFRDAGCDELIIFPVCSRPDQIDLLAEAIA